MNKIIDDIEEHERQRGGENVSDSSNAVSNSLLYKIWSKITGKQPAQTDGEEQQEISNEQIEDADFLAPENIPEAEIPEEIALEYQDEGDVDPVPVDARAKLTITPDKITAYLFVYPAENGGADITSEQIEELLQSQGIKNGIITETIRDIVENKLYGTSLTVASGIPATNGENGRILDCFSRTHEAKPNSRDDGSVDFKHLNITCNVLADTTICTIVNPTKAVDGIDIYGNILKGRDGNPAVAPKGQNTIITEDGLNLVAKCAGNLRFEGGLFHVDEVLHINGNVDNAVGNIDFCGDVIVDGDVLEGFHITAGKNVSVRGSVEGASIDAKGDIILSKGINGMNRGVLNAGKDVRGKFFENCTVNAGGSIYAESIMNCTVQSEDKIVVKGKRSIIVGGSYTALNLIEAKEVGAASHVSTHIYLGATPDTLKRREALNKELAQLQIDIDSATKDIQYLERAAQNGPLTQERKDKLALRKKHQLVGKMKLNAAKKKYELINNEIESAKACRLSCKQIYPPTKITIGNVCMSIREMEVNQFYYCADGEIKRGIN